MSGEVAPSLLIVEDDAVLRGRLARAFRERGFEVREAPGGEVALQLAEGDAPEHAVVDLRMPGMSGLEVVRGLKDIDPSTVVVVLTGYGSIATALDAVRLGAIHYLTKPADADEIVAAFSRAGGPARDAGRRTVDPKPRPRRMGAHQSGPRRLQRQRVPGSTPARVT